MIENASKKKAKKSEGQKTGPLEVGIAQSSSKIPVENNIIIITEELMDRLNPQELFLLSDLQIDLSTCKSTFSSVYMIGRSQFLKKIRA